MKSFEAAGIQRFFCIREMGGANSGDTSTCGQRRDGTEFFRFISLRFAEEVVVLQTHPVFRLVSEIAAQLEAMLRGQQPAAGEDVIEKLRADMDVCGELGLGQSRLALT